MFIKDDVRTSQLFSTCYLLHPQVTSFLEIFIKYRFLNGSKTSKPFSLWDSISVLLLSKYFLPLWWCVPACQTLLFLHCTSPSYPAQCLHPMITKVALSYSMCQTTLFLYLSMTSSSTKFSLKIFSWFTSCSHCYIY